MREGVEHRAELERVLGGHVLAVYDQSLGIGLSVGALTEDAAVGRAGENFDDALGAVGGALVETAAVARAAERLKAIRERQFEAHRFLHSGGEDFFVPGGGEAACGDWHLARHHARGLNWVDSGIKECAAPGHFRIKEPLFDGFSPLGIGEAAGVAPGKFVAAVGEIAGGAPCELGGGLHVVRLPVQAVADAEVDPRGFRGGDHLLALGAAGRHRFLDHDVLAGLGRGDRVRGVQAVGRDDVDDRDVFGFG